MRSLTPQEKALRKAHTYQVPARLLGGGQGAAVGLRAKRFIHLLAKPCATKEEAEGLQDALAIALTRIARGLP